MSMLPTAWERAGLVLPRRAEGFGAHVIGDPCIVWDPQISTWRMFVFADPPGHGHAICADPRSAGPGDWTLLGPLVFTNPDALLGMTHKPFVVSDPLRPNHAALIDGRYCLLTVSWQAGQKVVQQAWATRLAGPWTVEPGPLIGLGDHNAFDAKHADAVSGYYFPERREILYFYMGYPATAQPYPHSPYGSAQGVATQRIGERHVTKHGVVLPPHTTAGHWAGGWVGGLQLLPNGTGGWIGLVNASPTAPNPADVAVSREEPPPSLGGFAVCDAAWPVAGWRWCPEPIEWVHDIPPQAAATGEAMNAWRHHALVLADGSWALYYNSGFYGQEQLYMKRTTAAHGQAQTVQSIEV